MTRPSCKRHIPARDKASSAAFRDFVFSRISSDEQLPFIPPRIVLALLVASERRFHSRGDPGAAAQKCRPVPPSTLQADTLGHGLSAAYSRCCHFPERLLRARSRGSHGFDIKVTTAINKIAGRVQIKRSADSGRAFLFVVIVHHLGPHLAPLSILHLLQL